MIDGRNTTKQMRDAVGLVTALAMTLLALIVVAVLFLAREVLIPVALAVLLSFVLAPAVRRLEEWRLPRAGAIVIVLLAAVGIVFGLGSVVGREASKLADDLPRYQDTMRAKVALVRRATDNVGNIGRAMDVLADLGRDLGRPKVDVTAPPKVVAETLPMPVEIRERARNGPEQLLALVGPLLGPLGTLGLVLIFAAFILAQREDLRNRLIRLAGTQDLQRTTAAIDDAGRRLSRLFLTQLGVNAAYGAVIGVGLALIGVPSPALWGVLAGVLRYVPYIGAFLGAAPPLVIAAIVDPGWSMLFVTAALIIIVEPIIGHVIEPMIYGHSTGLSSVAVVLAATFWAFLWGPIGLILAVPLTVCLVVIGRHVERLAFLDVMLGDQPALAPAELFYQRMLAGDPSEAVEVAEIYVKEQRIAAYFDDVALPGLLLAQADATNGNLDDDRLEAIVATVREFLHELPAAPGPQRKGDRGEAICIAGRSGLDEAVTMMLGHILTTQGYIVRLLPSTVLERTAAEKIEGCGTQLVCVCYLVPLSTAHIRLALRRLRHRIPGARMLVGIWRERDPASIEPLRKNISADVLVTNLKEAAAAADDLPDSARSAPDAPPTPISVPAST